jgi:hypothetical protein
MSESDLRFSENRDAEVAEYRSLSGAAVGGLLLGLLSPAALVDPVVWFLPLLGISVSLYALLRIRRNASSLTGRKAALWGLCLSLCFAAAAPSDWCYYRYRIREEAKQYAAEWFDLLAAGRPEKAFQLTLDPKKRQPLDDRLWEYYRNNPDVRRDLDRYVAPAKKDEKPKPVCTLLALGKSARTQYLDAIDQQTAEGMEVVSLRYAVTFEEEGAKKTFYLIVQLFRRNGEDGRAFWRINNCAGLEKKAEGTLNVNDL